MMLIYDMAVHVANKFNFNNVQIDILKLVIIIFNRVSYEESILIFFLKNV